MTEYLKISEINFAVMTNGECHTFVSEMMTYLPVEGSDSGGGEGLPEVQSAETRATGDATAVGISAELIDEMQGYLDALAGKTRETRSSAETAELEELDRQRDEAVTYLLNRVSAATTSPVASERESAVPLWNALKVYSGITRLPVNDETASIVGMLVDINKEEFSDAVAKLGIGEAANELEELNNRYKQLVSQRMAAKQTAAQQGSTSDIRAKIKKLYQEMADRAFASNLLTPSEESAEFINRLNFLIDSTKKRINLRGKRKKDEDADGDVTGGEDTGGTTDGDGDGNDDLPVVQ